MQDAPRPLREPNDGGGSKGDRKTEAGYSVREHIFVLLPHAPLALSPTVMATRGAELSMSWVPTKKPLKTQFAFLTIFSNCFLQKLKKHPLVTSPFILPSSSLSNLFPILASPMVPQIWIFLFWQCLHSVIQPLNVISIPHQYPLRLFLVILLLMMFHFSPINAFCCVCVSLIHQ